MIRRITHAQFLDLAAHVLDKITRENGKPIVLCIADEAGDQVFLLQMDGTPARGGKLAAGKAYTAAQFGRTSTQIGELCRNMGVAPSEFLLPNVTGVPGGAPLFDKNGVPYGAVGVGGRSAAEDQEMADYCAKYLLEKL